MKQKALSALALMTLVVVGLLLPAPASAAAGDCATVTVANRVGKDSGLNGDWADTTITRVTKVCTTSEPTEGLWSYKAEVTDSGEFVTLAGAKSPGEKATTLNGGARGTVNGGFTAEFTAPAWDGKLDTPAASTPTGEWVAKAFKGDEQFGVGGPVAGWGWNYNLCGEKGEWWVNAEAGNSGDITERICPVASESPSPTPSQTTTSPSPSTSASPTTSPTTSPTKLPTVVTPAAPKVLEVDCEGVVYSSPTEGVEYSVGDYGPGWFVVVAKAEKGYVLAEGAQTEWRLTYTMPACGSESPNPTPSTSNAAGGGSVGSGTDGGGLPVTGARVLFVAGAGGLLVAVGGLLLVGLRRKRDNEQGDDTQVMPAI